MADYGQVLALWREAGAGVELRPSDSPAGLALKLSRDADLFLVAEAAGPLGPEVVGVIIGAWDGRRGWLHHLAVRQDWRGRGIGRALVARVEAGLQARGCLKINLLVRKANEQAIKLYRALGYSDMNEICAMGKELVSPMSSDLGSANE
jgi:ribosomal protein S18 acetylase RimI-like enzyme